MTLAFPLPKNKVDGSDIAKECSLAFLSSITWEISLLSLSLLAHVLANEFAWEARNDEQVGETWHF